MRTNRNNNNKKTMNNKNKKTMNNNNMNNKNTMNKEDSKNLQESDPYLLNDIENEKQYKPPEEWVKSLFPSIPKIISSKIITKEEYFKSYGLNKN